MKITVVFECDLEKINYPLWVKTPFGRALAIVADNRLAELVMKFSNIETTHAAQSGINEIQANDHAALHRMA
jgi:hypothetical protein